MPTYRAHWLLALALALLPIATPRAAEEEDDDEKDAPQTEAPARAAAPRLDGQSAKERGLAMLRFVATVVPEAKDERYPKAAAPVYAARLILGIDTDYALQKLDAAAAYQVAKGKGRIAERAKYDAATDKSSVKRPGPALDPFDKAALVNTYFLAKDKIPKSTALKIRDYVALYDDHKALVGYARGAWNYKLMLDVSGYLAAEEWPDLVDRSGLNASQIKEATKKRLMDDCQQIVTKNMSEYGATIYQAANLSSIRMLVEFARDKELRERATLTLDALLLDIACTWNNGYNIGSASRAKYWYSTDTSLESMASTAGAAWIFFGAHRSINAGGVGYAHSIWMAPSGNYTPPEAIVQVARARSQPFVHRSSVPAMGKAEVRRMTYHSPHYGLCSQWDQAGSPTAGLYKEARRNMLKWQSPKASSTLAVCMENPYRPYSLQEKRSNTLGYGENGFSQYLQHEGTLLGLYAVPETVQSGRHTFPYPYHKLYVPFPRTGSILKRLEKDNWVFCHAGQMVFGFRSMQPYTWAKKPWGNHDMLWVDAATNAWILETSELAPFAGGGVDAELDRFAAAVLAKTKIDASGLTQPVPQFKFTNLRGHTLDFTWVPHSVKYKDQSKVDGKPIDYFSWPMFDNLWVHQDVGSPVLTIQCGQHKLFYDFAKWTRGTSLPAAR